MNICCPFMIITAESVAVFVDCDYNSLNCDVTLREHQNFVILSKRSAAKDPYTNVYTMRVFDSNKSELIQNK